MWYRPDSAYQSWLHSRTRHQTLWRMNQASYGRNPQDIKEKTQKQSDCSVLLRRWVAADFQGKSIVLGNMRRLSTHVNNGILPGKSAATCRSKVSHYSIWKKDVKGVKL